MAWGKGKTEKGQGGKLGHSNRDGWGYHDEEKVISKKQRRLEQKQLILDETSKIDKNLREQAKILIQILNQHKINFEIHEFDSGAAMMDIQVKSDFYCIQMTENKFGWSKIDEDSGFSTVPDSGYLNWHDFKNEFDEIVKKYT
ncbi:hypothetical protein [Aquimarina sp. Aq107]|uniref:hypothetical protein n=1 Tax=Aquimarina sp. Aq107 TaxID=1191912 RepID=UPI000D55FE59|nr:hypothetical protein [Aquimarina sp. Aq107]